MASFKRACKRPKRRSPERCVRREQGRLWELALAVEAAGSFCAGSMLSSELTGPGRTWHAGVAGVRRGMSRMRLCGSQRLLRDLQDDVLGGEETEAVVHLEIQSRNGFTGIRLLHTSRRVHQRGPGSLEKQSHARGPSPCGTCRHPGV